MAKNTFKETKNKTTFISPSPHTTQRTPLLNTVSASLSATDILTTFTWLVLTQWGNVMHML